MATCLSLKKLATLLCATVGLAVAQPVGAALIDFETFPGGGAIANNTFITTQFASVGVTIFTTTSASGPQIHQFGLAGQSGTNALGGVGGTFAFFQPIGVQFSSVVSDASIVGLDIGAAGLILEAFDASNVLLDSDSFTGTGAGVGTFRTLSVAAAGIDRLVIRQILSDGGSFGDGFLIDDLRFTQRVPEPGTLALLGLGLAGLAASRRRKQ